MRFPKSRLSVPHLLPVTELSRAVAESPRTFPSGGTALILGQRKHLGFSEIVQDDGPDY